MLIADPHLTPEEIRASGIDKKIVTAGKVAPSITVGARRSCIDYNEIAA